MRFCYDSLGAHQVTSKWYVYDYLSILLQYTYIQLIGTNVDMLYIIMYNGKQVFVKYYIDNGLGAIRRSFVHFCTACHCWNGTILDHSKMPEDNIMTIHKLSMHYLLLRLKWNYIFSASVYCVSLLFFCLSRLFSFYSCCCCGRVCLSNVESYESKF